VRYNYRHDRISALAALTVSAQYERFGLYVAFQPTNFTASDAARFLRLLLRHLRGHVIVVWDNGRIHRGPIIRAVQERFQRLHLEYFPSYAPELNPVEQVWNNFKQHSANSLFLHKGDLQRNLHISARRVRRTPRLLRSLLLASDLPWSA
jgi:putative transposase